MVSAADPSEYVETSPALGGHIVAVTAIGILAGLAVAAAPVMGQSPRPINLVPLNLAMTAMAGVGVLLIGLAAVLRGADPVHRGTGVGGGVLMIAVAASFLISPLTGIILLTLATCGAFVTLVGVYLFGPEAEAQADEGQIDLDDRADDTAAEPVEKPRRTAQVIRHPAWHTPIPANLPRAIELKQEVCKPHSRLIL